jgi:hypothetical protein
MLYDKRLIGLFGLGQYPYAENWLLVIIQDELAMFILEHEPYLAIGKTHAP